MILNGNFTLGLYANINRSAGYHPDISAWSAQVVANGGTLTDAEKTAFSKARTLVSDTTWARIYQLCAFPVVNSIAKRTPIVRNKGPAILPAPVNSPVEVPNGYSYDGTAVRYVRLGITPSVDGISTLNAFHLWYQDGCPPGKNDVNRPFGGCWAPATSRLGVRWRKSNNTVEQFLGSNTDVAYAVSFGANTSYGPGAGAIGVSNRAANDGSSYRNGVQVATDTTFTLDAPPTGELWSGGTNGGGGEFPVGVHSFSVLGQGLTTAQIKEVQSFMDCSMQNLGFMRNIAAAGDSEMADGSGPNLQDGTINPAFVSSGYSSWYQASVVNSAVGGTGIATIDANLTAELAANPQYQYWNRLWSILRNDLGVLTIQQLVDGTLAIMRRCGHESYRWVEVINNVAGAENAGSPLSIKRIAVNAAMEAAIGQKVIRWQHFLQSKANINSLADVQALDNDLIPISLSDGAVHTNAAGKPYYREAIWNGFKNGWLNVSQAPFCYGTPLIWIGGKTGTNPAVGDTLKITPGGWGGNPDHTYQWTRNGVPITDATNKIYTLVAADISAVVTCIVGGSNAFGSATATPAGMYIGMLQSVTASSAAAYSVHRLSSTYAGSAMRVRRDSDQAEQDIGFTATGNLDTSALLTFVGAGSGFVTTLYDQSGNSVNATQSTAANQPRIVNAGVVETMNSRPCVRSLAGQPQAFAAAFATASPSAVTVSAVFQYETTPSFPQLFDIRNAGDGNPLLDDGSNAGFGVRFRDNIGSLVAGANGTRDTNPHVGSYKWSGSRIDRWLDGTAGSGATTTGVISVNRFFLLNNNQSRLCEWIAFFSDLSTTDRQTLERAQGAYYGVAVA